MRSSKAAFDAIVAEEVSSKETYIRKYQRPEWPGESSGVTVGIGYDLGQTDRQTIRADWTGRVSSDMLDLMVACSGKTGQAGRTATNEVRNAILIPWDTAIAVHKERAIPRWEAKLKSVLPNTDKLSPDCFGVLLSLIFNRGTSFNKPHDPAKDPRDRYREMRAIKGHMATLAFDRIPAELRSMKRLWPDSPGLQKRRDREAALFEKGLRKPIATETKTAGGIVATGTVAGTAAAANGARPWVIAMIVGGAILAALVAFAVVKARKKG